MTISSLMLDLEGIEITEEEQEILQHPCVGAVILFSRNYESPEQLAVLIDQIRKTNNKELLICVDHEGGRVQRFRSEFTELPAVGKLYDSISNDNPGLSSDEVLLESKKKSYRHGWLMAAEIRAMGIDFSFAPVLDINYGVSEVIGDRSFNRDPFIVSHLASHYIEGMRDAGMASTGKHFPGHGAVIEDSHLAIPRDTRSKESIWNTDIVPFKELIRAGLDAVMPAHVIYSELDDQPAGFSNFWLQDVLRKEMGFSGVIFSDDLTMEGASVVGGFTERAEAALAAGCDMVLVCNNRKGAIEVIDRANIEQSPKSAQRLNRMIGQSFMNRSALLDSKSWVDAVEELTSIT